MLKLSLIMLLSVTVRKIYVAAAVADYHAVANDDDAVAIVPATDADGYATDS